MRPNDELLYDSEASLRLVDHAIEELSDSGAELDRDSRGFLEHVMTQPGGFAELSRTLLRAYAETVGIVQRLRESCGIVDAEGHDRLQQMHGRLQEVSSATETATTGILDSVTRAIAIADRLDGASEADRKRLVTQLKDELRTVPNHLQFQDITAQQLGHIASLLSEMRKRISQMTTMFEQPVVSFAKDDTSAFDPNASAALAAAAAGQAVADEIFAVQAERKSA
jgi:chemotaxis regulatin CheY-phosphate phosphatase CheZ